MNPIKYYEFIHNNEQYIVPKEWLAEHDKQIREKTIDECISRIRRTPVVDWIKESFVIVLEQLKEQL